MPVTTEADSGCSVLGLFLFQTPGNLVGTHCIVDFYQDILSENLPAFAKELSAKYMLKRSEERPEKDLVKRYRRGLLAVMLAKGN